MDRDLVEQARRGDREAFAVLVHQVSDSLYAVAYRILRDTGLAEDALQNALVLAWRRLPQLRDADRFEAWIHRILVHACYDESQRARHWTANVRVLPVDGPSTPDGTDAVADRDELERAFRRLSVEQRAVFVLHHYLGLPLVEIAELLEIPAGTARSRLHYAIAGLRDALTADAEPDRPGKDGSHDRRPLARTRRSVVDRGRSDPGAGARRRGRPRSGSKRHHRNGISGSRGGCPAMTTPARVAAAAVVGVLAIGGVFAAHPTVSRSAPGTQPTRRRRRRRSVGVCRRLSLDAASALAAYREARNAICEAGDPAEVDRPTHRADRSGSALRPGDAGPGPGTSRSRRSPPLPTRADRRRR